MMEHLIFTQPASPKMDAYVRALNIFITPMGYKFRRSSDECGIDFIGRNGKKITQISMSSIGKPYEQIVQISKNRKMTFNYGKRELGTTQIKFDDKVEGMTEISFTFDCFRHVKKPGKQEQIYNENSPIYDFAITKASIYMKKIDHSESYYCLNPNYYLINYDRFDGDMLKFTRGNDIYMWDRQIAMSRSNTSENTLMFSKVDYDDPRKHVIVSTGDDYRHKIAYQCSLREEYFKVLYEIYGFDGSYSYSDLSDDILYKHYSNSRLVNNKDVREFLDSILEVYNARFSYGKSEMAGFIS